MKKCEFCGCECQSSSILSSHKRKCKSYLHIKEKITRDVLVDMYINRNMSCLDIQKHFGLPNHYLIYLKMKEYGINRRSMSEAAKASDNKRRKTNIEKYGHGHNFCRNHPSRKEWENKLLKEEGITNVFQRESVKKKLRKTLLEKYGTESSYELDTVRGNRSYSSIHRKVVDLCHDVGLDIDIEFKLQKDDSYRYYSYDIIINGTKKLIEVYGDYWHANPLKYKPRDLILKGSSREMTARYKWDFDKRKNQSANKNGYEVLIVWESDISDEEYIRTLLLDYSAKQMSPITSSSTRL